MQLLDDDALTAKGIRPKSKTQRWRLMKASQFPKPIKIGSRNVWLESEIDEWIRSKIAARDTAPEAA